jgi:hypothetical protein
MKNNFRLLLALILAITFSNVSAQTQNPLLNHLPVDAEKVYYINYNVLTAKLDWQALGVLLPKNEENQKLFTYFSDPGLIGIDMRTGVFVTQSNVTSLDSPRYTTLVFALSDSAKFIRFLKDQFKSEDGKLTIHAGKLRTGVMARTALAWDDKLAVISFVKAPVSAAMREKMSGVPSNAEANLKKYLFTATRRCVSALKGVQTNVFMADPDFRTVIADDADVHIYSRFGGGVGMVADMMRITHAPVNGDFMAAMEKMKHIHMHTIGTVRFDNGQMTMRSRLFYDSLAGIDLGLRPISTGLIDRLPRGNLLGFFALHLDPMAYLNLLKRYTGANATSAIDSMLAKKDMTIKDIMQAFKGDVIVAAIDNGQTVPATDSTPAKPGTPGFYIVLTIADKAAFDKFDKLVHLTRDSAQAPSNGAAAPAKPKFHFSHNLHDDILVLGTDKQATDNFFNQAGRGSGRLESDEVRNAAVALAVDVKAIGAWLGPSFGNASGKGQQAKIILDLFDQVIFTAGQPHGKEIETLFEIRMSDQQQNSLTTISKLIAQMSKK